MTVGQLKKKLEDYPDCWDIIVQAKSLHSDCFQIIGGDGDNSSNIRVSAHCSTITTAKHYPYIIIGGKWTNVSRRKK